MYKGEKKTFMSFVYYKKIKYTHKRCSKKESIHKKKSDFYLTDHFMGGY